MTDKKPIELYTLIEYPTNYDDLVDKKKKTVAAIYTLAYASVKVQGITKAKDGIYDIVVGAREINNLIVNIALKDLSRHAGREFIFKGIHPDEKLRRTKQKLEVLIRNAKGISVAANTAN